MKIPVLFRSIYARFAVIFIAIWWIMNSLTFAGVMRILSQSTLVSLPEFLKLHEAEMLRIKHWTQLVFLGSIILGTLLILLVVRGIVRPIHRLSKATHNIAEGDFDIQIGPGRQDEIGQLTQDFNRMAGALSGIDSLRKDFVANVSHEFKTPLTAIAGYASLIEKDGLAAAQQQEYARLILNESHRLSRLSSDLLRLSQLDSNQISEQAAEFMLDEQIRQSILLLESQWTRQRINLDIDLAPVRIRAAEHLLREVWINLISNAIKFSNAGDSIRIELIEKSGQAIFSIEDNGIGISETDQARVFERFFQADRARGTDSSGLGLAITQKIVEQTGGSLSVESTLGQGSTFRVKLPTNIE